MNNFQMLLGPVPGTSWMAECEGLRLGAVEPVTLWAIPGALQGWGLNLGWPQKACAPPRVVFLAIVTFWEVGASPSKAPPSSADDYATELDLMVLEVRGQLARDQTQSPACQACEPSR